MSKKSSPVDRKWEVVLYPDSEDYVYWALLADLEDFFDMWAYALHDLDTTDTGELKKPHVHFLGKLEYPVSLDTLVNRFGIKPGCFKRIKNWRAAVRYLIHFDEPYDGDSNG